MDMYFRIRLGMPIFIFFINMNIRLFRIFSVKHIIKKKKRIAEVNCQIALSVT